MTRIVFGPVRWWQLRRRLRLWRDDRRTRHWATMPPDDRGPTGWNVPSSARPIFPPPKPPDSLQFCLRPDREGQL